MTVAVKDLRYKTKEIIQSVRRGERPVITFHGHAIAKIIPLSRDDKNEFREIGFGMWGQHKDKKDVQKWLEEMRNPRFKR